MLTVLASTLALALAFGPQLQINLQAALDEPPAVEAEVGAEETPVSVDAVPEAEVLPLEEIEETIIEESEIAEREVAVLEEVADSAPEPETDSGEVPAAEWPAILDAASTALAAAETATGKFMQTNADGTLSTGTFALNRPGRMRFDYDDPIPVLIVSDGTTVAMEDSELETVDRIPIGTTPLGLILSTDLNVDEDVEVLNILRNEERVGIRVSDASGELEGTLTMVFDKASYDLLGWLTVDGNFQTTIVDLVDVETNVRIDPRLFRLNEDDDEEDER
ncbi:MAG: outer-membrane lipoprotein carrier protein LolA [Henriciella sp.]|nr:outer-membrane lipoprotein carrier protein LolA [Henriciella sp.]